jgi:hypothetical protein
MNISEVKPLKIEAKCQQWLFSLNDRRYAYFTYEKGYKRVDTHETWEEPKSFTEMFPVKSKGPEAEILMQYLPLDICNPTSGIERFYKLLMLQ